MKVFSWGWRPVVVAVVLTLMTGCGLNTRFTYKPDATENKGTILPVNVVVLPFQDGTEDFTVPGLFYYPADGYVNIVKAGFDYRMDALPSPIWGKYLADDLAASGCFRSVRFAMDTSKILKEDIVIEGVILKAYLPVSGNNPSRLAVRLDARNGTAGKVIWQKVISREVAFGGSFDIGCGFNRQCAADRYHRYHNQLFREIFLEARWDLVAALSGAGEKTRRTAEGDDSKQIDEVIDNILKGK